MTNTVGQEQLELLQRVLRVLESAERTPVTQQMVIELAMAWHAQKAGADSNTVIDAMAKHARQMITIAREGRR